MISFGVKYRRYKRGKDFSRSLKTGYIKSCSCLDPGDSENPSCLLPVDHRRRWQTKGRVAVIAWRMRKGEQPWKRRLLGLCFVSAAFGQWDAGKKWWKGRWWHHCPPAWTVCTPHVLPKLPAVEERWLWGAQRSCCTDLITVYELGNGDARGRSAVIAQWDSSSLYLGHWSSPIFLCRCLGCVVEETGYILTVYFTSYWWWKGHCLFMHLHNITALALGESLLYPYRKNNRFTFRNIVSWMKYIGL